MQGSTARRKRDLRPSDARRLAAQMAATTEWSLFLLNLANTAAALLVPCCLVTSTHADAVPGFVITMAAVVLWLKLVSYAHCNYDLRWTARPVATALWLCVSCHYSAALNMHLDAWQHFCQVRHG